MNVDKLIEELEGKLFEYAERRAGERKALNARGVEYWDARYLAMGNAIDIVKRHAEICDKCEKNN